MSITKKIEQIRDERVAGKNTAKRIGECLMAIVEEVTEKVTPEDLNGAIANKVDKVQGKQLSTNDYTDLDKAAVEKIATIQETANRAYNTAWSNFNEYYGTINVGNERGDGSMAIIYGATTEKAGLMTAADKERLDRCASDDSIGQLASEVVSLTFDIANKVDKVQGKQLSTLDYNYDERQKVDNALRAISFNVDATSVSYTIENNLFQGSSYILPAATPQSAGIMTAADKRRLDDLRPLTAKMPIRKGTWLRLAEWSHELAMAEFTLRLRQLRYVAEIRFAAVHTNVQAAIYLTHRAGDLLFIDKIATATEKSSQKTYLYVHLCESLTAASALPNIDIQAKGIGWNILTPTPISGEVNDETHSGRQEILLHTISPLATPQQDGYLSAADKRKIDSFDLSLQSLIQTLNQLAERVEALEN